MKCKTDKIQAAWAAGDRIGALRIAAQFFDRSANTKTFKRGIGAHNNPDFYRQLGKDPKQLIANALELLAKKFNLQHDQENAIGASAGRGQSFEGKEVEPDADAAVTPDGDRRDRGLSL
jgi:hypothetical protein